MELLDPNKESTWRNSPAPSLDPSFRETLKSIGGVNIYGQPNLRIVWGQEHMTFQRGKMRLRYVDRRIPALEHLRHVLKRPLTYDADGRAVSFERKIVKAPPRIIPKGWLYEWELESLEFIGDQLFYIEQWVPVHLLGNTPEEWEELRYEDWEDPELGLVKNCDVLGPFPNEGQYREVFAIGEPYVYPVYHDAWTGDGEHYYERATGEYLQYREPGADTLEALREKWYRREHETLPSVAQRSKDRYYNYRSKRERQFDKYRQERQAWFRDALSTTGKREALARTIERQQPSEPASVSVPAQFNRKQRRAMKAQQRRAA